MDGMQALDMGFPEFTESMTTDEKLEETKSYLVQMLETLRYLLSNLDGENFNETGLKEITEPITAKIADVAGNVTELEVTAEGLKTSVANAEGKASTAQQTADGVKIDVQNLKSRNTVVIDATGLYVIDAAGRQTKLSGDQITSGTINGIYITGCTITGSTITTANTHMGGRYAEMNDGSITAGYSGVYGELTVDPSDMKVHLYSNNILKLIASGAMSAEAGGDMYIQTAAYGGSVHIGNGGIIDLSGTVLVNGVPLSIGEEST